MAFVTELLPTTCDIYRPFGDASPMTANVRCRLVADFARGRWSNDGLYWTHYLEVDASVDIVDGCSRMLGSTALTFADGDEVRIPAGAATPRFAVVWVESIDRGTPREFKRAYLVRHEA